MMLKVGKAISTNKIKGEMDFVAGKSHLEDFLQNPIDTRLGTVLY